MLGLVLNAVVLCTTRSIDAAVAQLRADGHEFRDEDIARLSPLGPLQLHRLLPREGLRPLRDPDAVGSGWGRVGGRQVAAPGE